MRCSWGVYEVFGEHLMRLIALSSEGWVLFDEVLRISKKGHFAHQEVPLYDQRNATLRPEKRHYLRSNWAAIASWLRRSYEPTEPWLRANWAVVASRRSRSRIHLCSWNCISHERRPSFKKQVVRWLHPDLYWQNTTSPESLAPIAETQPVLARFCVQRYIFPVTLTIFDVVFPVTLAIADVVFPATFSYFNAFFTGKCSVAIPFFAILTMCFRLFLFVPPVRSCRRYCSEAERVVLVGRLQPPFMFSCKKRRMSLVKKGRMSFVKKRMKPELGFCVYDEEYFCQILFFSHTLWTSVIISNTSSCKSLTVILEPSLFSWST